MLKTVDVLIGFTLVMLIMSMAVTLLTQAATSALNSRGRCLKQGIANLLRLLDRGLRDDEATQLADYLLRDTLLAGGTPGERRALATAVHREELTKLLLELAVAPAIDLSMQIRPLQTRLQNSLTANGIPDPQVVLDGIRITALQLEKTNPEMSNSDRMNTAILRNAASDYVGKLNAWFDQTMDRVSETFTKQTRIWTVTAAVLVALVLQLDAVTIINRLSIDDKLREDVVTMAIKSYGDQQPMPAGGGPPGGSASKGSASPATPGAAETESSGPTQPQTIKALKDQGLDDLLKTNLIEIPSSLDSWWANWSDAGPVPASCMPDEKKAASTAQDAAKPAASAGDNARSAIGSGNAPAIKADNRCVPKRQFPLSKLVGVLISAALISLGAPFWYEMLKNLIRLRSLVATKDDADRNQRQTAQSSADRPPAPQNL